MQEFLSLQGKYLMICLDNVKIVNIINAEDKHLE